jgi:UDP-N-acetylmuramoylalanine--D-glutamate ligase
MTHFSVVDSRVVVVGAGRSGLAAARLLARRGARVTLSEAGPRIAQAESLAGDGIVLESGGHRDATLRAADLIVLSPGVSPRVREIAAARRRGVPVISEVELAARWLQGRLVAVTGTKGKSTTVVVTGRMLEAGGRRAVVGGNIGVALSSQVESSTPDVVHVVEVSSFQLELTETFRPWIAVCLNLSPDHLDRHASFEEYAGAKARLFANQTPDDAMVINADDPHVLQIARAGRARALRFAVETPLAEGVQVTADGIARRSADGDECLVPMSAVRVPGRHLLSDIAAAAAVGTLVGIDAGAMARAVGSFRGLEHTLEFVGESAGVRFVNDSKATNVVAARAAIECFGSGLVVILGGRFKGGRFEDLRPALAARGASVVAIGEARPRVRRALEPEVDVLEAETMDEAVRLAAARSRPGGAVLLAPACASLDMFRDYAARGAAFRDAVAALGPPVSENDGREQ